MSQTKHTPGPWSTDSRYLVSGAVRLAILDDAEDNAGLSSDEAEANGRLIAAAPELLAALRDLLAAQEALNDTGYDISACQQYDRAEAVAVALLARLDGTATGEPESAALSGSV